VARPDIFAIRVSPEERQMIDRLAEREERTPSDVVRRLIRQAIQNNERTPSRQEVSAPAAVSVPS
jgi:predicted DNA-binding protein